MKMSEHIKEVSRFEVDFAIKEDISMLWLRQEAGTTHCVSQAF